MKAFTHLGHIADITVDEKAEVSKVDVGGASQVEVVKPPNVQLFARSQSTNMVK